MGRPAAYLLAAALVVGALLAPSPVPPPSPVAAATKLGCRPADSKTIVKSTRARVFRRHGLVYGCLFRRNRAVALTTDDGYGKDFLRPPTPRLAGRFVAYTYYWEGAAEGYGYAVRVTDLRTGDTNLTDFDSSDNRNPSEVVVNKLIVTGGGSLAWGWTLKYDARVVLEIRKLKPGHSETVVLESAPLDSGPDVDPASLRRAGATIYWKHGTEERSAQLP